MYAESCLVVVSRSLSRVASLYEIVCKYLHLLQIILTEFNMAAVRHGTKISVFGGVDSQYVGEHCSHPKKDILARNETFWTVFGSDRTRRVVKLYIYTGWAKNGLFLRSDNFATTNDRKVCNTSKVSEFCLK